MNYVILFALCVLLSCNRHTPVEGFEGLPLGVPLLEFREQLIKHELFVHNDYDYRIFQTKDHKFFYTMPRGRENDADVVTTVTLYMSQNLEQITSAGRAEMDNPADVYLNLTSVNGDFTYASEGQIYEHLQNVLKQKYKVQNMTLEDLSPNVYKQTIIFANNNDLRVTLDRIVERSQSVLPPMGRIKVTYELTKEYMDRKGIKH